MTEVVCGVISNAEGKLLACLRPAGKHLAGKWEFPGGKVDPGESQEAALTRELQEELGISVQVGSALRPVVWSYQKQWIRLSPYYCRILQGDPQPLVHEQLTWCAPADFGSLLWADADQPILREILDQMRLKV
jgi:8-oxo-dGTP diphosphatase